MRCAKLYYPGQIELVEVPEPEIQSDEDVKIRVNYGALNADDYNVYIGKQGQTYCDYGLFHEISGEIVQLGAYSARTGLQVGDHVAASPFIPCGSCPACRAGKWNLCREMFSNGLLAEYVSLNHRRLFRIPQEITPQQGSLTWLVLTCVRCMERLSVLPGQRILILGAGSSGQILVQLARRKLPSILAVSEPLQSKRTLAVLNGADVVIDSTSENLMSKALDITDGAGFDIIIDAAGDILALQNSIALLERGGKLMIFASYDFTSYLNLNLADLYWKECVVMGVYGATNSPYTVSDTKILSQLSLDSLIGKVFPLSDLKQAFEAYGSRLYTRILVQP
ncbi:MAG: alcohol dehydrogenase catalytic domain-containing protein [Lachnospiraceae bacterium]|nr:alcohol dehydrogenase catalytic domain-containing protein [Lachnospiraceae bacterium]